MNVFEAFILGVVQGLTEFLPVSSSGHLVLLQKIFGMEEGALTFNTAVHFATLLPVIYLLRQEIFQMIKKPFSRLTGLVIIGTVPTVIIALVFKDFFEGTFKTGSSLGLGFIITGLILLYSQGIKNKGKDIASTKYKDAAFVGIVQGIAILPAVSRSGSTLAGSLFRGMDREFAFKFSFLMAIPAITGAALKGTLDFIGENAASNSVSAIPILVGMAAAAVSGYFALMFVRKLVLEGNLKVFSYYVFTLGGLVLLDQIFFGIFF